MKKIFLVICGQLLFAMQLFSQENAIKLFIPQTLTDTKYLDDEQVDKLLSKTAQLVTNSGIAEIGYSNFLLLPKFYINEIKVADAGLRNMYVAFCSYTLQVARQGIADDRQGRAEAVYASKSFRITGSGTDSASALNNAINNIDPNDDSYRQFIEESKAKVGDYFRKHCDDVMRDAEAARNLQDNEKAISLYLSIPSDVDTACYKKAIRNANAMLGTYYSMVCNKKLLQLKFLMARIYSSVEVQPASRYDSVINIVKELNIGYADSTCYSRAMKLVDGIEKKMDEDIRKRWQIEVLEKSTFTDVNANVLTAMKMINAQYVPPPKIKKSR